MPHALDDPLTLDTRSTMTATTLDDRINHATHAAKAPQIFPAAIHGAPASIRTSVHTIAGAKVEHFAEGSFRYDGAYVVIGSVDAATTVHAEKTGMVAGVDGAGPVFVNAGGAIAMLT